MNNNNVKVSILIGSDSYFDVAINGAKKTTLLAMQMLNLKYP